MSRSSIRAQVEELAKLEKGWDSYGGLPPTPMALLSMATLADAADWPERATVFPLPDGGLSLEWSRPGGEVAEIEMTPQGSIA